MKEETTWFDRHPAIAMTIVIAVMLLIVELVMHAMYFTGILPNNVIYMTQLEKAGYRENVNSITYEDHVPRRGDGFATYAQRGIPPQYIEFDEQGMRIDNYMPDSGSDIRIGVFGDSYTDALQVGQYEAYASILEDRLRDSGCPVDVRNYGLGATGTSVQYLRYRQLKDRGEQFDHIILTLFQNDIINNQRSLDQIFPKSYEHYPYLVLAEGELIRDVWHAPEGKRLLKGVKSFLHRYSHLANTIFNLKQVYQAWENSQVKEQSGDMTKRTGLRTVMDGLYNPPMDPDWISAWDVTESIIQQWKTEASTAGEKFTLVILTESVQLDDDKPTQDLDYDYPNERLSRFSIDNGIDHMDFLHHAREYVVANSLEYPFLSWEHDGHYAEVGHELLASALHDHDSIRLTCNLPVTE